MRSVAAFLLPVLAAATPILNGPGLGDNAISGDAPNPKEIQFTTAQTSGSGCKSGTVTTTFSPDMTVVTFGFDEFQTYIGGKSTRSDSNKNCQLHLNLKYPGGYQFAVFSSVYHGWAQLDAGVQGQFSSTYFFSQDASATTTTSTTITGGGVWAAGSVYTKEDRVPTSSYIWSPCGGTGILNINNRIILSTSDRTGKLLGEITNDDATIKIEHQLNINWRTCKK
jgi:hypothetical protein